MCERAANVSCLPELALQLCSIESVNIYVKYKHVK